MTPLHKAFAKLIGEILGRRWVQQRRKRQERQDKQQPVTLNLEHINTVEPQPKSGK